MKLKLVPLLTSLIVPSLFSSVLYAEDVPLPAVKVCETGKIESISYDLKRMVIKMPERYYTSTITNIFNFTYDAFKSGKNITVYTSTSGTIAGNCNQGILEAITIQKDTRAH